MGLTCGDVSSREYGWLCGTFSKHWAAVEGRTGDKQAQAICEALVCRKSMASGFLRIAGALCSIFAALLRRTLPRSSGFSVAP